MGTQQEVIKKFIKSLDDSSKYGTAALDEAVNYASSGIYSTWDDLVTAFVNDVSLYGGDGASTTRILDSKTDSFLKEYCGIDLNNTDTGAITGYDTGGSTTQISAEDIVPESNVTAAVYPTESQTTYNGVTVVWPDASTLSEKEQEIVSALYSWWLEPALELVEQSIGISFNESDAKSHTLTITFDRSSASILASANLYNLTIYSQAFETIDTTGGEYSGKRTRGVYFDRILAHELTHAIMSTNETDLLWDNTPICVDEGLAELVHGADDGRKSEIVKLAQSVNASSLNDAMYYTRSSTEDHYDAYAGGYMLFRYFAKQVSNRLFTGTAVVDLSKAGSSVGKYVVANNSTGKVNATFTTSSVSSSQTQVGTVAAGKKYTATFNSAQSISAASSDFNWNITGTSGDDTITGGNGNDSINGGAGDDLIIGGSGNDTLTGGNGSDTFVCSSEDGNDVIKDYTVGEDVIILSKGTITGSYLDGSDVVLNIGSGSIKIKNGAKKLITVGTTSSLYGVPVGLTYNSADTVVTLDNDFSGTLKSSEYYSTVKTITAAARSGAVHIKGNTLANIIRGSSGADTVYGGSGNDSIFGNAGKDKLYGEAGNDFLSGGAGADTLTGGKGNDTLTGGSGNDVFVYASGDGNDVITDYTAGQDSIRITSGSITNSSISGNDVILNISSGSITVKNGKGKSITVVNSSGKSTSKPYVDTATLTVTNTNSATLNVDASVSVVDASTRTKALKVTGNSLSNTIKGGSGKDTIYGGAGSDSLLGNAGNDSLSGGTGADTLNGGKGNDTLTGGSGNDVFVYAFGDGNDVITDYTTGQDSIKLTSGSIESAQLKGSDVVLNIASSTGSVQGSITLKNAKNKFITIVDSKGNSTSKVYPDPTSKTITDADSAVVTVSSDIKTIVASTRTKAVKITGNSLANTIKGGSGNDTINGAAGKDSLLGNAGNDSLSGGTGADTLYGGKGNDTLTGGSGNDVFVYASGDGNDVITDYTAGQDKIKLTSGSIASASIKGNDMILKIGSGSITLKNSKDKTITITDSSNTTKNYTVSSSAFIEETWFLKNDDSSTQSYELDSILDTNANSISLDYNSYDKSQISTLTTTLTWSRELKQETATK
ncbi:MAG: calcium-binding protein [Selenomonadaceae bacterium]|nr:calcium-binding protein [Selenomonadaceae bacterium]